MGYTHYWNHTKFMPEDWARLVESTQKVFEYASKKGIPLGDAWGEGSPEASVTSITFNGAGDEGYESFEISPNGTPFSFCKTDLRPYDAVVTAVLILACHFHDGFEASSNGVASEWQPGYELASQATGINSLSIPKGI